MASIYYKEMRDINWLQRMNGNGNGKYLPNMFRGHGEAGQKGKCRLSEKENSFKLNIRTPKISYGDFLTAANFAFLHPVMGDVQPRSPTIW